MPLRDERQYGRYDVKRQAGISDVRPDGSRIDREGDLQATAAERFAVGVYGQPFREQITKSGDHEPNMRLGAKTVDVKWLGWDRNHIARTSGYLIVNPGAIRHDIYVLVAGSTEVGFRIVGWATHEEITARPKQDFGHGMKHALHTINLRKPEELSRLARQWIREAGAYATSGDSAAEQGRLM